MPIKDPFHAARWESAQTELFSFLDSVGAIEITSAPAFHAATARWFDGDGEWRS